MNGKTTIIVTGVMLSILILPSVSDLAFAQYLPTQGQTGLEEMLKRAEDRVNMVKENPHAGSGTPMFALDGVVGALILSTGVFGGIAATFFVKGSKGKYAAMGRG